MNIISIIEKLLEMQYSFPTSEEDVIKAEKELNLVFADEYKKYLLTFGAVQSDIIAISGICDDKDYEETCPVEIQEKVPCYSFISGDDDYN